ncbi:MAG: hypothetical protein OXI01_00635 [Albidovulum sp.]|nr:hypothetical protein [Albidovulum sp.]
MNAARASGRKGGGKKTLTCRRRAHGVEVCRSRKHAVAEICSQMGISRATLCAYVNEFSDGE